MNKYDKGLVKTAIIAKLGMWSDRQEKVKLFFKDNKTEIENIERLDKKGLERKYLECNDDHAPNFKLMYSSGDGILVDYIKRHAIKGYQKHSDLRDFLGYYTSSVDVLKQALRKIDCITSKEITFNEREECVIFGDETIY